MHGEQPHCALIVGKTNSGKTKWILDLVETEYRHQFEAIVIICPTLLKNKTYLNKRWSLSPKCVACDSTTLGIGHMHNSRIITVLLSCVT